MQAVANGYPRLGGRPTRYSRPVTTHTLIISALWATLITDYAAAQLMQGQSANTIRSRVQHLQQLARSIKADPSDITTEALLRWASAQSWAHETRRGRYNTYRSLWAWAKATKRVPKDVGKRLPKVSPGAPNPRPCPDRVYRKAMMKATERERLWLELAHDHGLRRGEVAVIHTRDIFEDLVGYS